MSGHWLLARFAEGALLLWATFLVYRFVRYERRERAYMQRVRLRAGRVREDIAWAEWLARNGWQ